MSGFTPLLFAYVFTAVFLAGIVRGATGFGFSMIMIVLLTLFFPPAQVHATSSRFTGYTITE